MDENDVYDTGEPDTVRENLERYGLLDYKPVYERCARIIQRYDDNVPFALKDERCDQPVEVYHFVITDQLIRSEAAPQILVPEFFYVGLCATHAEEQGIDNE